MNLIKEIYEEITNGNISEEQIFEGTWDNNYEEIKLIVEGQVEYLAYVMEHSGFETVMFPYFGKFGVKPRRIQKLNEELALNRQKKCIYSKKKTLK